MGADEGPRGTEWGPLGSSVQGPRVQGALRAVRGGWCRWDQGTAGTRALGRRLAGEASGGRDCGRGRAAAACVAYSRRGPPDCD